MGGGGKLAGELPNGKRLLSRKSISLFRYFTKFKIYSMRKNNVMMCRLFIINALMVVISRFKEPASFC